MAKLTTYAEATSLVDDDMLYAVTNVAGVPTTKKVKRSTVRTGLLALDQTTPQAIVNGSPIMEGIQFDTTPSTSHAAEGLLRWNNVDETLDLGMSGGAVTQQIGQELFQKVRNVSGTVIANGTPVYVSGRTGDRPNIYLAKGDVEATSHVIGVTTQAISDSADGFVTIVGYVREIKTNYSGAGIWGTTWNAGDQLYVSKAVAGQLTNVVPAAPHHCDAVATVEIVHGTLGSILVNIKHHVTLEELSDVNGTALNTTGQIPVWDDTNKYFDFTKNIVDLVNTSTRSATARFGGETDYTSFEADGTLKFNGAATVWDDLRLEPTVRGSGANNPSFTKWIDNGAGSIGIFLYEFTDVATGSQKEVYFTTQMPHGWKGTAIYPHVHWLPDAAGASQRPVWGLEYSWAEIGATFGNSAIVYTTSLFPNDTNLIDDKHYISSFNAITPSASQDGLSSILICRLFRFSGDASDTFTGSCGLLYIDLHYEIDTIGSRSEFSK